MALGPIGKFRAARAGSLEFPEPIDAHQHGHAIPEGEGVIAAREAEVGGLVFTLRRADARSHHRVAHDRRRRQLRRDAIGTRPDRRGLVEAREQDDELVAAPPTDGVGLAHRRVEAVGGALQDQVTELVAECVVDLLEVINVEQNEAEPNLITAIVVTLLFQDL